MVALALPERDAAQSGGIQSTMRNVGQAIGVALLGAVLLFGITSSVRVRAAADPAISPSVAERLSTVNINLGSDADFELQIVDIPITDAERSDLVRIQAQARFESTRIAYAVGAAVVLLGLASTPAIKVAEKQTG